MTDTNNMKHTITVISDTHTQHKLLDLPGGDTLIFAGDLMNNGHSVYEVHDFLRWFMSQDYDNLIFIAGNHEKRFEDNPEDTAEILKEYEDLVTYLQDNSCIISNEEGESFNIYGSPWQPEFYNWAFNLPKDGAELTAKWEAIPDNTDILVTHGPPYGILDTSGHPYNETGLGCAILRKRVDLIKPKIHIFGHIHGSYGHEKINGTHFINASVLNEQYKQTNKPITFEWDIENNNIHII